MTPPRTRPATAGALHDEAEQMAADAPLVDLPPRPQPSLAAALVQALAELTVVGADRSAEIPLNGGGSYSYKYAAIEDVVKHTRPVLAAHGIVALTPIHDHGGGLACTVTLLHESGDRLDLGPFPFPHGKDAQATGSMVTYHRRYALIAALGMAAGDDDDDGAAARPAPRPVVWDAKMAKYHLVNLLGGDKALAGEVWKWGDAARWPAWDQGTVESLVARYKADHPPAPATPPTSPAAAPGDTPPPESPPEHNGEAQDVPPDPLGEILDGVAALNPLEVEAALFDAGVDSSEMGTDAERRRALAAHRATAAGLEL